MERMGVGLKGVVDEEEDDGAWEGSSEVDGEGEGEVGI